MLAAQFSHHRVPQFPHEFNPRMLSGLAFWYDASMGFSLNAGNLSAWADQSGNGYNQVQGIAGRQPPWSATATRGVRPGVTFSGSQGTQTGININYGGATKITIFVVGFGSLASTAEIIESSALAGTVAGAWNIAADAHSSSDIQFTTNATGSSVADPFFVPAGFNSPSQLNCIFDLTTTGVQASARYNGSAASLTASGAPATGSFSNQQLNLGARSNGGSLFWTGTLCAVYGYLRALTTNELVKCEKYNGAMWMVPS